MSQFFSNASTEQANPPPSHNRRADDVRPGRRDSPDPDRDRNGYSSAAGSPVTLAGSVRRHPFLVILPVIILLVAGIVVGAKKHPTYSAIATINVGKADINTQATPGYVQASEALATTYARLVSSQHVSIPVARALRQSPVSVASRLTAVPIPSEPTFTITATGQSATGAVALANATVKALQQNVSTSATQQGSPAQLLEQYQQAQATADELQSLAGRLQGRYVAGVDGVTRAQVTRAKVAGQTAALKAQALSNQYLSLSTSGVAPVLDVLVNPTSATSTNRTSNIEKYAVIGAAGGLVIGLALAGLAGALAARRRRLA